MPLKILKKGSPEAFAWARKMATARRVRKAGKKAERAFFGPGAPLEVKKNPKPHSEFTITEHPIQGGGMSYGIFWYSDGMHTTGFSTAEEAYNNALRHVQRHPEKYGKNPLTVVGNPNRKPAWFYDGASRSYVLDLGSGIYSIRPTGLGFRLSYTIGSEVIYMKDAAEIEDAMDMVDHAQGVKFKRPKGIYGSTRLNPLIVAGNPAVPSSVNAMVEGVVYNRCIEICAEKTAYRPGFYRHPFAKKSKVKILALSNGDLLIHSCVGEHLWKPA